MKSNPLIFLFVFIVSGMFAQEFQADQVCLSQAELRLAEHINTFRKENRKPVLPLSSALSFVAQTHVKDLQENHPDTSICLTTSWSDKGNWTACCYNKYLVNQECMWSKPKELTSYPFRGYELSYFQEEVIAIDSAFNLWLKNEETRDMLLTTGTQSAKRWEAMGLGVSDNYISVWFGQRADAAGKPKNCEEMREAKIAQAKQKNAAERYYLIYGSFSQESDAKEAIKRYKKNGFKNAIIHKTDQRIRIALDVFDNLKEATEAKEKLSSTYKDAWILKE